MTYEELERQAFIYWIRTGIKIDIDKFLLNIEHKSVFKELDLLKEIEAGNTLLIGEGNFSFALSVASSKNISVNNLVATCFEAEKNINEETKRNIKDLKDLSIRVLFDVDCTKLENHFNVRFDRIIFNFPNTASRESCYNKTENYYLLKNFLKSSINILKPKGKVIVSIVDTPYYKGSFGSEDLNLKEYQEPITYKFNPSKYKAYNHTMTHKDKNGLEKYENFISLVFILK
jgi:hypothetical protein